MTDPEPCDYCGATPGADFLFAEISRDNGKEGKELLVDIEPLGFCNVDHAARYLLEGRLPEPDFSKATPYKRSWRDRFVDWSVLALLVILACLVIVGTWSVAHWFAN